MKSGDLIGFSSHDLSGFMINLGSFGIPFYGLSHIGILAHQNHKLRLYESTTLCELPCLVQKKIVSGAQVHNIDTRVAKYNGKVYHIPLTKPLNQLERLKLTGFLLKSVGRPYDMLGAGLSGGHILRKISRFLRDQDLNNLFCSEWCAAAHNYLNRFHTGNASTWNPNAFYRESRKRNTVKEKIRIK